MPTASYTSFIVMTERPDTETKVHGARGGVQGNKEQTWMQMWAPALAINI